jgi:DNA-directed RNA polymerase specialized sigma24 family protein
MNGQIRQLSGVSSQSERVSVRGTTPRKPRKQKSSPVNSPGVFVLMRELSAQITQSILDEFKVISGKKDVAIDAPILMRELSAQITQSFLAGFKETVGKKDVVIGSNVPITKEKIAVAIALDMSGKCRLPPHIRQQYDTMLYDAIRNLVYSRASRFFTTCPNESVDDLAQECMQDIFKTLHSFDPRKGVFTTWSWHVCRSTLSRKYQEGKKIRSVIVDSGSLVNEDGDSTFENMPGNPIAGVQTHECSGVLANEIRSAVRLLAERHPAKKELIFEILGNPYLESSMMPCTISVSESAKAVGMEYSRARTFFTKIIRPFMQEQFAGC